MIKLLDILLENYFAPLYHATSYFGFISIIKDNKIKPGHDGKVSLTRNKNYKVGGNLTPIIFVINQNKVREKYKIYPTYACGRMECEEFIKNFLPLEYVTKILVPEKLINKIKQTKNLNNILHNPKIEIINNDDAIIDTDLYEDINS